MVHLRFLHTLKPCLCVMILILSFQVKSAHLPQHCIVAYLTGIYKLFEWEDGGFNTRKSTAKKILFNSSEEHSQTIKTLDVESTKEYFTNITLDYKKVLKQYNNKDSEDYDGSMCDNALSTMLAHLKSE